MILVCPSCSTRYLLSSSAIGADGRDVRCAKCAHQWFQAGDQDMPPPAPLSEEDFELADSVELDPALDPPPEPAPEPLAEEPIPESVKPLPEGSNVPAYAADVIAPQSNLQAQMSGYGAALFIFLTLLSAMFVMKEKIVLAWPPLAMVYELAGMPIEIKGEGLVMETLSADLMKDEKDQDVLVLSGRVINLTDHSIKVPPMMAVLRSTNGEDGERWLIEAPVDQVEPGASFAFKSDYAGVPKGIGSVNLTFVPILASVTKTSQVENH